MNKDLWLFVSSHDRADLPYVVPTIAWMAKELGALFETYLESPRDGRLFAEAGSTVLGGHHHQQFNYLCARFNVVILELGETQVFTSSREALGLKTIARAETAESLYAQVVKKFPAVRPKGVFYGPESPVQFGGKEVAIQYYLFPEIYHRHALGYVAAGSGAPSTRPLPNLPAWSAFISPNAGHLGKRVIVVDRLRQRDSWKTVTERLAKRWKQKSRGVVFGDAAAVMSQMASHCRHDRIAVYSPQAAIKPRETRASCYAESVSPCADFAAELAIELGNPVIHGRQTGDGDIFAWSKHGVGIQIVDPNRPAFPVVSEVPHRWTAPGSTDAEVSDSQLAAWADEGRVLSTLIVHSGEVAHNEAMLALVEMVGWNHLKMGIGVHAQRYETCPQLWELIAVGVDRGGAAGLVEPLLHSGGQGVLAEWECPPRMLATHCHRALKRIEAIAGRSNLPKGYYAFMDSNFDRLDRIKPALFSAIASEGMEYIISSALPGRNRVLWENAGCLAINQTPRVVYGSSPFVRAATADDIENTTGAAGAGWLVATLDAPVVAFAPYIWREGNKIMEMAEELRRHGRINVLPSTISRYARLLRKRGIIPNLSSAMPNKK